MMVVSNNVPSKKSWLRYLIPDEKERGTRIEEVELLRGFLILTTFSHHGGGELTDLVERYMKNESRYFPMREQLSA
jgi:hypothetical protein